MESIQEKRDQEKATVVLMIEIYCRKNHKERNPSKIKHFLCPECRDLADYAMERSQKCPFIAKGTKTFCSCCKVHCYKYEYREKIRKVMKFSGPRILFYMPGKCLQHLFLRKKNKKF